MRIPVVLFTSIAFISGCASQNLVGAWRSEVRFTTGDFAAVKDLEFLYVFNHGGTMTESSNYDSAPPVPPAYGVWRATGPRTFKSKYLFYTTKPPATPDQLPQGWPPAGHGELTENITMTADGKSFDSQITLQLFDATGHPSPGGGQAAGRGTRVAF